MIFPEETASITIIEAVFITETALTTEIVLPTLLIARLPISQTETVPLQREIIVKINPEALTLHKAEVIHPTAPNALAQITPLAATLLTEAVAAACQAEAEDRIAEVVAPEWAAEAEDSK